MYEVIQLQLRMHNLHCISKMLPSLFSPRPKALSYQGASTAAP